jgi:hypothetical protein
VAVDWIWIRCSLRLCCLVEWDLTRRARIRWSWRRSWALGLHAWCRSVVSTCARLIPRPRWTSLPLVALAAVSWEGFCVKTCRYSRAPSVGGPWTVMGRAFSCSPAWMQLSWTSHPSGIPFVSLLLVGLLLDRNVAWASSANLPLGLSLSRMLWYLMGLGSLTSMSPLRLGWLGWRQGACFAWAPGGSDSGRTGDDACR